MTEAAQAPVPGSPEHDAAMIALAEKSGVRVSIGTTEGEHQQITDGTAPQAPPSDQPEAAGNLILGKFKTQEDLVKAYAELEKKLGAAPAGDGKPKLAALPGEAQPSVTDGEPPELNPEAPPQGDPTAAVPPDLMAKASAEFEKDGKFSDDTYTGLAKAGISRAYADAYVDGLKARAEVVQMKVYSEAGSKDEYVKLTTWAQANLDATQIAAYNASVTSGDINTTLGAIKNLKALYAGANGSTPETRIERTGGSGNEPVADMYRSKLDVQKDMNDPRYRSGDRAFHAAVDRKLEAAMAAGIDLGF
jgi:hypothetical protein